MRQLKNFMKAKKPMWNCGECKCITLKCWRENDEFCNCGTSSEGLGVEYKFKNWDGRILKQGSIEEGATPTPPADPTREATAEYTYTFAGWDPEVGPISEDTVYTAQFEATPRNYTVTIGISPEGAGTVDTQQVTVAYGTAISASDNVLTIGSNTITATAGSGYTFSSWGTLPATVTENLTITASFETTQVSYTLTLTPRDETNNTQGGGSLSSTSYTVTQDGLYLWFNNSYTDNLRIVTDPTEPVGTTIDMIVPTPDTGYYANGWYYYNETQQDWVYIFDESEGVLIAGDIQIRCYFGN